MLGFCLESITLGCFGFCLVYFHTKITRENLGFRSFLEEILCSSLIRYSCSLIYRLPKCEVLFVSSFFDRIMYSSRPIEEDLSYAEMDPTERYGRFKDVLGKGAVKTVYRAFDEFLGVEVAWNQVKLNNLFKSPDEIQRLYSEVHLLKNLNHVSIMKFHASWIDVDRRTFNFISELFTSGTLRAYRKRFKRVNVRAIKDWARQILKGLEYLHGHDPPVIHRDLKCDNIFVNGHLGQVKIGDLGLAAILEGSCHAHSVIGTPEFMAPELYEEEYDELVDIYSFGMCVLEMLTSEYPYNECSNPAQIYKKVTTGKLPNAFYQIEDDEARRFVGRCLSQAPNRPSACELLNDPFLLDEEIEEPPISESSSQMHKKAETQEYEKPSGRVSEKNTNMTITGTMNSEEDTIFLKVQISDKNGCARNIHFQFDTRRDTPSEVAEEMVKDLEITDWEAFEISDMIDLEISSLIPSWKDSISPRILKQDSFNYIDDNDENSPHHPFYPSSSFSSSQDSLPGLFSFNDIQFERLNSLQDCCEEESKSCDDSSSHCSSYSYKYSSSIENVDDLIPSYHKEEPLPILKTQKSTRFCPVERPAKNWNKYNQVDCSSRHQMKIARTGSLMDIRSQLLHRMPVSEMHKLRLFNTVGAVEHIGYQLPDEYARGRHISNTFGRKSSRENRSSGFKYP